MVAKRARQAGGSNDLGLRHQGQAGTLWMHLQEGSLLLRTDLLFITQSSLGERGLKHPSVKTGV